MLLALYAITVLFVAGEFVSGPILSPLLLDPASHMVASGVHLAARSFLVTLIIACFCVGQIVGAPLWGVWADRYGFRRCLLVGLAVLALSYVLSGVALQLGALHVFMASRALCGFATSLVVVVFFAMANSTDAVFARRTRMGNVVAASAFGTLFGGVLGGFMGDPGSPASFAGFASPFYVLALAAIVLMAVTQFADLDRHSFGKLQDLGTARAFMQIWNSSSRKRLLLFLLYYFFFALSIFTFYMGFPISSVVRFSLHGSQIGAAMILASIVGVLSATLLNRWLVRYVSVITLMKVALLLLILVMAFFAWCTHRYGVYISMAAVGLVDVLIWTSGYQLMSRLSPADCRGKAYGLMVFVGSVASLIAALGLAHWAALQAHALFAVCALSLLISLLFLWLLRSEL